MFCAKYWGISNLTLSVSDLENVLRTQRFSACSDSCCWRVWELHTCSWTRARMPWTFTRVEFICVTLSTAYGSNLSVYVDASQSDHKSFTTLPLRFIPDTPFTCEVRPVRFSLWCKRRLHASNGDVMWILHADVLTVWLSSALCR